MIDIEKLAKEHCHHQQSADQFSITLYGLKQFSEAYAAKVLEDKEREIARMDKQIIEMQAYEISMQNRENDDAKEITELQAYINDLREALEDIAKHTPETFWQNKSAQQALSKTPAQSLQAFENEVIERCAQLSDACAYMSENFNALSEEIRALKVTNE